ncbi:MAG TPA: hypothetical protein VFI30_06780 [Nocardioidaceae bacterium]|nr:hypothetical protein [Nocardioidaceae bacterium]
MDVNELVAALRSTIESARSMPMSASAMVNRGDVLDLIRQIEVALPTAFADSQELLAHRDAVLDEARRRAAEIVAEADLERERLVCDSEVFRVAKHDAEEVLGAARREHDELRAQIDAYVDTKLATFEIALTRTLDAVTRGRDKLQGRSPFQALAAEEAEHQPVNGHNGAAVLSHDDLLAPGPQPIPSAPRRQPEGPPSSAAPTPEAPAAEPRRPAESRPAVPLPGQPASDRPVARHARSHIGEPA